MPSATYDMLAWGGGRRGGTYWPCPSSSHGSCFLILGPAGWSVLHRHSHCVDPLSLSLAQGAAANVGGDCLVWAKIGTAPGAWTTPKLWKVIAELDMAGSGCSGRLWSH